MGSITYVQPYEFDVAVLSGGDWETNFPLENIRDSQPSNVARAVDNVATSTQFIVDAGVPVAWDTIVMANTNFSAGTTIRVNGATSEAGLLTTGFIGVAESIWPLSGRPSDRDMVRWDVYKEFNPMLPYRWWLVIISDPVTVKPQIGRVIMAKRHTPQWNMSYGAEPIGFNPADIRQKTNYGFTLMDKRRRPRYWTVPFNFVSRDDAEDFNYEFTRLTGSAGDFFVIQDPDDVARLHRKMMLATMPLVPRVRRVGPFLWATNHEYEELI